MHSQFVDLMSTISKIAFHGPKNYSFRFQHSHGFPVPVSGLHQPVRLQAGYRASQLELSRVESGVLGNALDGVDMETKPADEKDALVEDTEAMPTNEKSEIEGKVAVALDENYDKHDLVARAHFGDITEDSMDEAMEEEDAEMVDAEKVDIEVSNLEQAWQMKVWASP